MSPSPIQVTSHLLDSPHFNLHHLDIFPPKQVTAPREYWEARGPLAEGHKGRINRPKPGQKRASFLSIRMTGEKLTQLRDAAAKHGMGSSTYARQIIKLAIKSEQSGQYPFIPEFPRPAIVPYIYTENQELQLQNHYDNYLKAQKEMLTACQEALKIMTKNISPPEQKASYISKI